MSVVLVIIGLIVGGILVGQDLVRAAAERAQITQIEKYNQAVNTFRVKYNALPGNMNETTAAQFGFAARGTLSGQGDGNGILMGSRGNANDTDVRMGTWEAEGETSMFWSDLSYANGMNLNLIEGSFSSASCCNSPPGGSILQTQLGLYFPAAKNRQRQLYLGL